VREDVRTMARRTKDGRVAEVVERIRTKMQPWGITVSFLASRLGVSRQYAWQIVHYRTAMSFERACEIEAIVDTIIAEKSHMKTFGERLRAARRSAGLTLKEAARLIGYSWVGVERWERDLCLPKPGVLWHLLSLYGLAGERAEAMTLVYSSPSGGFGSLERSVGALDETHRYARRGIPAMSLHPPSDTGAPESATGYAARALSAHRALRQK
jgi:transcriptional regulator with XRE-family HTH domain